MKISAYTTLLHFKFPFVLAAGTRSTTEVVYLQLEIDNNITWAEAALPPYFNLTGNTVLDILKNIPFKNLIPYFTDPVRLNLYIRSEFNFPEPVNCLLVSIAHNYVHGFYSPPGNYLSSLTVSDSPKISSSKLLEEQNRFSMLKIKIGSNNDKNFIENIIKNSLLPFCVDVNRGWKNKDEAANFCQWLEKIGCKYIEQPFESNKLEETNWLRSKTSIPVIADEAILTFKDLTEKHEAFDGINIKILKCGGPVEAEKMIEFAKNKNLKIIIGCMSESQLGCATAAKLCATANLVDLDGPYLIKNNFFNGYQIENGKIKIDENGIQPTTEFLTSFLANAVTL